ncbi:MAG TPA: helix-turn-helix domain-containing protein [Stellaceae bacterium]|nr:helix-turn-helix domain-containing protein [Stellaceae bacterium]
MKVSREQVAANRQRILEAAGLLFKERGFAAVTVAEVMQAAGLTHGGFYGYFGSKDELAAAALAEALTRTAARPLSDLATYIEGYLSRSHRENRARGCPTAALAAETIRETDGIRAKMTAGVRQQIERLSPLAPGRTPAQKRQAAIGSWAAMVGAMILARASSDPALSAEVLEETRAWLSARAEARRQGNSRSRLKAIPRDLLPRHRPR